MSHFSDPSRGWVHRRPTLLPGRAIHPAHLYRARAVLGGFFMWMAFAPYALHTVRAAGLNPYQLIAVAVVLELTVVVFEVPTGVLADAVSRRLSVILGTVIAGVGWAVMGLFPSFEGVAVGQFLWGFGFTFMSGASEAWLADEIGEDEAARVYPQAAQRRQAARVAGVLVGAGLGLLGTGVPFVVGGVGHVLLGTACLFTMTEAGWRPAPSEGSRAAVAGRLAVDAFRVARRRPMVRAALAVSFLFGAASEVFESLWAYHLLEGIGVPIGVDEVVLFGGMVIAAELGGLGVVTIGRWVGRDGSRASAARVLAMLHATVFASTLAFALVPGAWGAIVLAVLVRAAMGVQGPFLTMWVNRGLEPRTRATVLSTVGMANSVGQAAQGRCSVASSPSPACARRSSSARWSCCPRWGWCALGRWRNAWRWIREGGVCVERASAHGRRAGLPLRQAQGASGTLRSAGCVSLRWRCGGSSGGPRLVCGEQRRRLWPATRTSPRSPTVCASS